MVCLLKDVKVQLKVRRTLSSVGTSSSNTRVVKMFTIIFPWGKYSYLRLPMGFAGSADIFQAEMMDLMEALEYVRAYIDDLLVITRGTLEDHLAKLREVLRRLREAGLKVNAIKSHFCTHNIEYLGYILTREGIKPQPKKVQAILVLVLNPPNNVKELWHFLGMEQYYCNMWAIRNRNQGDIDGASRIVLPCPSS